MKKHLVISVLMICLAGISPLVAQEAHPGMDAARNAVGRFLQLDEEQLAAWDQLWIEHREAMASISEDIADVQEQIEELFAQEEPDPTALGELMIQRHDLGGQMAEAVRAYNDAFAQLLDEDQAQRLDFIRNAHRAAKFIPAFQAFELIRRH